MLSSPFAESRIVFFTLCSICSTCPAARLRIYVGKVGHHARTAGLKGTAVERSQGFNDFVVQLGVAVHRDTVKAPTARSANPIMNAPLS